MRGGIASVSVLLSGLVVIVLIVSPTSAAVPRAVEKSGLGAATLAAPIADNFQVLGHANLVGGSPDADVFFYDHGGSVGKYAYVGTWSGVCSGTGVKIVNVNNPANPKLVALAGHDSGVSTEDMVVARIGGRDILGVGVQICKGGRVGGLQLFDVTNPSRPTQLSFLPTPAGGVHELDLVVRPDGKALALLAVPFAEFDALYFGTPSGGDFRIVDVTDPSHPVELANWGVIANSDIPILAGIGPVTSPFQGTGGFAAYFAHSVRAADGGMAAYVSYWDGGVLRFDIRDPARPQLLARTTYPIDADGDAHSLGILDKAGQRYLLQNDEDFSPFPTILATSSATGSAQYAGIQEPWATFVPAGGLSGAVHDAGDGCDVSDYTGAAGKVVLADAVDPFYVGIIPGWTVPCLIGGQILLAAEAGAGAFVSNLISPDDAWPFFQGDLRSVRREAAGMPVVQISNIDGLADAIRRAAGTVTITVTPSEAHLGFLRIYSEGTADDVDRDGILEFHQIGAFESPGESVHNTEVLGDRAYSSWYSHGIIAIDMSDPSRPVQVGQFVPPSVPQKAGSLGVAPTLVWGVAIDPETGIIYASDMQTGLWIIQPTGNALPST